jgi:hypothetical protein
MDENLTKRIWWEYLDEDLKELIKESVLLVDRVGSWQEKFHDYAFVVFPAAKAYEGYLKNLFLDMGFISEKQFYGKRFRIGKALNPSLNRKRYKKQSVYDRIVNYCGGKEMADVLWDTWKQCRNILFHWFPNEKNTIDYKEAKEKVTKILDAMNFAFKECKIK